MKPALPAIFAAALGLGCAAQPSPAPQSVRLTPAEVPDRRTIAAIESGFALREDLRTVGVVDSETMNRNARVKVRGVSCAPTGGAAICTFEANRCLTGESDDAGDGWCRREAETSQSLIVSRGWTIDRPRS
jgi:hypothetical protein